MNTSVTETAGTEAVGSSAVLARMVELADQWIKRARRKFCDAKGEKIWLVKDS
jgi:hypothetical protein